MSRLRRQCVVVNVALTCCLCYFLVSLTALATAVSRQHRLFEFHLLPAADSAFCLPAGAACRRTWCEHSRDPRSVADANTRYSRPSVISRQVMGRRWVRREYSAGVVRCPRWPVSTPSVLGSTAEGGDKALSEGADLAPGTGGQYRLMLVDDEEALRKAVSEYLRQRGYSVTAHGSAQEGLFHLKEAVRGTIGYAWPDLIITDINMPMMDGYQFLAALRMAGGRVGAIPVVFLTARGLTADRIQGYRAGINAYLAKPFDPEELVSIVDSVLLNTMNAAEVAAAEAATTAYAEAALSSPVGHGNGNDYNNSLAARGSGRSEDAQPVTSVVDVGENGDVLGDVRRELGDIKALLLADRAQRRQSEGVTISGGDDEAGEGTNNPGVTTRAPKLLTSSDDRSSNRSPDPYSDQPLGSQSWSPSQLGTSADPGQDSATMGSAEKEDGGKESEVSPLSTLTRREVQVLDLLTEGHTNREIATLVGLGVRSIEKHVSKLLSKTGTSNRTELVRYSLRTNLTKLK